MKSDIAEITVVIGGVISEAVGLVGVTDEVVGLRLLKPTVVELSSSKFLL